MVSSKAIYFKIFFSHLCERWTTSVFMAFSAMAMAIGRQQKRSSSSWIHYWIYAFLVLNITQYWLHFTSLPRQNSKSKYRWKTASQWESNASKFNWMRFSWYLRELVMGIIMVVVDFVPQENQISATNYPVPDTLEDPNPCIIMCTSGLIILWEWPKLNGFVTVYCTVLQEKSSDIPKQIPLPAIIIIYKPGKNSSLILGMLCDFNYSHQVSHVQFLQTTSHILAFSFLSAWWFGSVLWKSDLINWQFQGQYVILVSYSILFC